MRSQTGSRPTGKHLTDLLPSFLKKVEAIHQMRPDLLLSTWPELIGEKLAPMTKAVSFEEGILTVKVKNSTLYSLLVQNEKERLVKEIKKRFPSLKIRTIRFCIG